MNYIQLKIDQNASILNALKQMDVINRKLLLVFAADLFMGVLSVGDIQRAIIRNISLDSPIKSILRKNFKTATVDYSKEEIKSLMVADRMECLPILNSDGSLCNVVMWEDILHKNDIFPIFKFNLPVVIMAGGQGTRLKPLTNIIPKPLIPIGEKTFIEDIMDRFTQYGSSDFYVSVNYKADVIKNYFKTLDNCQYNVNYFQEDKPLGTAGSLSLLRDKIHSTFFVTNCDVIINEDYSHILKYHKENHNELTVVAALKNYPIAYGVLHTKEDGLLDSIVEKPDVTFKINTGVYILEPGLLNELPDDEFYHITFLIEKLIKENRRVGVFPVSEKSWIDVGNWNEYLKLINQ